MGGSSSFCSHTAIITTTTTIVSPAAAAAASLSLVGVKSLYTALSHLYDYCYMLHRYYYCLMLFLPYRMYLLLRILLRIAPPPWYTFYLLLTASACCCHKTASACCCHKTATATDWTKCYVVSLTWYLSLCFVEWLVKTLVMIHYTACSCYCCYTITILHYTTSCCYRRSTAMQTAAICLLVLIIRFYNKTPTDTNFTSSVRTTDVRTQYERQFAINYNVGFCFLSITVC